MLLCEIIKIYARYSAVTFPTLPYLHKYLISHHAGIQLKIRRNSRINELKKEEFRVLSFKCENMILKFQLIGKGDVSKKNNFFINFFYLNNYCIYKVIRVK